MRKEGAETPVSLAKTSNDPFAFLRRVTSELDDLFEAGWPAFRPRWAFEAKEWVPSVEVFQKDQRLVARFALPGLTRENINVEAADGRLVVSGERKRDEEEKKEQFYRSEHEYGSFYRSIPLPEGAKVDEIKASLAEGVLEVVVPLAVKVEAPVRKVEIEDAKELKAKAAA